MNHILATDSSIPEVLKLETIREAVRLPGPCITILLPPYHPGDRAGSPATILKSNIQEGARLLAGHAFAKSETANLLQPFEQLADNPTLVSGSHWSRIILRSPGVFNQFYLTQPMQSSLRVAESFTIKTLVREIALPAAFYILALSKTRVSLLRCAGLDVTVAPLPRGIPETLAEALALEPPDHDLENRSSAGSSTGSMRRLRFGAGSEREGERAHLADYYKLVDRAMQELLREPDAAVILAGVEEDMAIYRVVSTCHAVVKEGIPGSPDISREQIKLLQQGYSILRTDRLKYQATGLMAARERTSPSRFSTDPDTILRAAFEGRVGELYLDESAEKIGRYEQSTYRSWGNEDLLNLAAVQTILNHGKTCELPTEMMPNGAVAAGFMRF